jgi:hypothetical protein
MTRKSRGRRIFGKTQQILSCFIVVVVFSILFLPYILSPIFVQFENMMWNAYFHWAVSLVILNSSINSVIFFRKNKVLRKEAIKLVKNVVNHWNFPRILLHWYQVYTYLNYFETIYMKILEFKKSIEKVNTQHKALGRLESALQSFLIGHNNFNLVLCTIYYMAYMCLSKWGQTT